MLLLLLACLKVIAIYLQPANDPNCIERTKTVSIHPSRPSVFPRRVGPIRTRIAHREIASSGFAFGIYLVLGLYFTVYSSSHHNTVTIIQKNIYHILYYNVLQCDPSTAVSAVFVHSFSPQSVGTWDFLTWEIPSWLYSFQKMESNANFWLFAKDSFDLCETEFSGELWWKAFKLAKCPLTITFTLLKKYFRFDFYLP